MFSANNIHHSLRPVFPNYFQAAWAGIFYSIFKSISKKETGNNLFTASAQSHQLLFYQHKPN